MATLSPTQRRPSAAPRARVPARVRRLTPPPRTRLKQRLADARAHEVRARRELTLALARAEQTYELAVRNLQQFDEYLDSVRARLHQADCLAAARGRGRSNLL